jgi:hypothetical protein
MRAVMVNIINVIMTNTEYEAVVFDIINTVILNTEDVADVMINTNPNVKHDEVNVVRQEQADKLLKVPEIFFRVRTLAIKLGDDNGMGSVMVNITDHAQHRV